MPGRDRRVASRQGQLNRRRKRQQRGPSGIPVATAEPVQEDEHPDGTANGTPGTPGSVPAESAAGQAPSVAARATPASRPSAGYRLRRGQVSSVNYVAPELRRILIMAGGVFIVLIALAIVWPL